MQLRKFGRILLLLILLSITYSLINAFTRGFRAVKLVDGAAATTTEWHHPNQLRVAAYNIAHGRGGEFGADNWDGTLAEKSNRYEDIANLLLEIDADVVVLNEVDFKSFWSGHVNQADILADLTGYPHWAEQRNQDISVPFFHAKIGNVIFSRYPILEAELIELPALNGWERLFIGAKDALLVTVALPDETTVQVLGIHLEHRSEQTRADSAEKILELLDQTDTSLIAAGDFNSTLEGFRNYGTDEDGRNAMMVLLEDGRLAMSPTSSPGSADFTFPSDPTFPHRRVIDWVLHSDPWQEVSREVVQSDLSDHLPVVLTLTK